MLISTDSRGSDEAGRRRPGGGYGSLARYDGGVQRPVRPQLLPSLSMRRSLTTGGRWRPPAGGREPRGSRPSSVCSGGPAGDILDPAGTGFTSRPCRIRRHSRPQGGCARRQGGGPGAIARLQRQTGELKELVERVLVLHERSASDAAAASASDEFTRLAMDALARLETRGGRLHGRTGPPHRAERGTDRPAASASTPWPMT